MTTLVDTSVLLDIMAPSAWRPWSEAALAAAIDSGEIAINQVIYAEVAAGFVAQEGLERTIQGAGFKRLPLPWASAWLVAEAFRRYRRVGGAHSVPLPDFFIGAHAQAARLVLLTRDPSRVRTYFPEVEVISPPSGADDPTASIRGVSLLCGSCSRPAACPRSPGSSCGSALPRCRRRSPPVWARPGSPSADSASAERAASLVGGSRRGRASVICRAARRRRHGADTMPGCPPAP